MSSNQILYIKGDKNKEVSDDEVKLGDILAMECADENIVNRLKTVKLLQFRENEEKRIVVSVLKIICAIHKVYPNLTVENLGETDLIITRETKNKTGKAMYVLKTAFVLVLTFIGSGFSIMSFSNDVSMMGLFDKIYEFVTGTPSDGFTILELTYSIGLSVGILIFFNHFGKKRFTDDPTPMEVEMRIYEDEIEETLVDEYSRKEKEIDVGSAGDSGSCGV